MLKDQSYRKLLSPLSLFILCSTLVAIFIYSMESQAMFGFFKKTEVQLSPPVKGRITDNGKPLSGLEVVRELFYRGYDSKNKIIDYALTNKNGEFSFEEKIIKSRSPNDIFGQNLRVSQDIYIKKDVSNREYEEDKYYWLWLASKGWRSMPTLNALMLQLNADLQNKEVQHEIDLSKYNGLRNQPVISICHWQDDLITTYYNDDVVESYSEIN